MLRRNLERCLKHKDVRQNPVYFSISIIMRILSYFLLKYYVGNNARFYVHFMKINYTIRKIANKYIQFFSMIVQILNFELKKLKVGEIVTFYID